MSDRGTGWKEKFPPLVVISGLVLGLTASLLVCFGNPGNMGVCMACFGRDIAGALGLHRAPDLQYLRFAGGIRDMILFRSPHLLSGLAAVLAGVLALNLILDFALVEDFFKPGFSGQPPAHNVHLWNYLGMALVGLGSVLLGGCPFRQLVLASQGNGDSAVAVLGMLAGAAAAHNFGLSASGRGVPVADMVAVGIGLAACLLVASTARQKTA